MYVEGRLKSRTYEGQDGTTRFSNDINVVSVEFLGGQRDSGGDAVGAAAAAAPRPNPAPPLVCHVGTSNV